jgi:hypothetical protein
MGRFSRAAFGSLSRYLSIIRKVRAFIQKKAADVSLQRIAKHVYLHPSSCVLG